MIDFKSEEACFPLFALSQESRQSLVFGVEVCSWVCEVAEDFLSRRSDFQIRAAENDGALVISYGLFGSGAGIEVFLLDREEERAFPRRLLLPQAARVVPSDNSVFGLDYNQNSLNIVDTFVEVNLLFSLESVKELGLAQDLLIFMILVHNFYQAPLLVLSAGKNILVKEVVLARFDDGEL